MKNIQGREVYFSASSAKTFRSCRRRWWFSKVLKIPQPKSAALTFGIGAHAIYEHFLQTGDLLQPGDVRDEVEITPEMLRRTRPGLLKLPKDYVIEEWLDRVVVHESDKGRMLAVGKLDMYKGERAGLHIIDHKTSSDPERWGHTEESLAKDPQGLFYAGAKQVSGGYLGEYDVAFSHNYVAKRGRPRTLMVDATMKRAQIERAWGRSVDLAGDMLTVGKEVRTLAEQDQVPFDRKACRQYNTDCPFMSVCSAAKKTELIDVTNEYDKARKEKEPMSLFSKIKSRTPPKKAEPENRMVSDEVMLGVVSKGLMEDVLKSVQKLPTPTVADIKMVARRHGLGATHVPCIVAIVLPDELAPEHAGLKNKAAADLLSAKSPEELLHVSDEMKVQAILTTQRGGFQSVITHTDQAIVRQALEHEDIESWQAKLIQDHLGIQPVAQDPTGEVPWRDETSKQIKQACEVIAGELPQELTLGGIKELIVARGVYKKVRTKSLDAIYDYILALPQYEEIDEGTLALTMAALDGRPTKSEPVATEPVDTESEPEPGHVNVEVALPQQSAALKSLQSLTEDGGSAPTLTVICVQSVPMGVPYQDIQDMPEIIAARAQVAALLPEGSDWRTFSDYGDTGPRRIVTELERAYSRGQEPTPGWWFIGRSDPLVAADVVSIFRAAGAVSIRGVL